MSLRSGKVKSNLPPNKRKYKTKTNTQIEPAIEPQLVLQIDPQLEQSSSSLHLVLDESIVLEPQIEPLLEQQGEPLLEQAIESIDNLTLDEYDREIPRDNPNFYDSIDAEMEKAEKKKSKSKKGMPKPALYQPLTARDYNFQSGKLLNYNLK